MRKLSPLVVLGWFVFALAWFLPVIENGKRLSDGVLPGWEAFAVALDVHGELHGDDWGPVSAAIARLSAITNFLMFGSMVFLARRRGQAAAWLAWSFTAAMVINLWWASGADRQDLLWGYWLWMGSFALVAIALFVTRQKATA
jgi:hypothetical protein